MDEARLRELVKAGKKVEEIAYALVVNRETVRRRIRALGLETVRMERRRVLEEARRDGRRTAILWCEKHGRTDFVLRTGGKAFRCVRCRSEAVSDARRRRKEALVQAAGGRCQLCGYDRYVGALQFHHLDPAAKQFAVSQTGVTRSFERAMAEVRKCVLLCGNCHAEVEAGFRQVVA